MSQITSPIVANVPRFFAPTLSEPKTVAIRAPKKAEPVAASLLESMRALDGSKEDRFNVAHAALTTAYTVAMTYGNKTQLTEVLASTGKKVCEKAMRAAVQEVGVLGLHKDAATRQQAIVDAVNVAVSLFAAIACVVKPKQVKAAKVEAPKETQTTAADDGAGDTEVAEEKAATKAERITGQAVLAYAKALPDAQLAALADSLMRIIEARAVPMLKAA